MRDVHEETGTPLRYLVSAAFDDYDDAEAATRDLIEEGFERDRISVLLSDETRNHYLEVHPEHAEGGHVLAQTVELEAGRKTMKGAGVGSAVGGAVGAAAAAVAAAGTTLLIGPLGLVVAGPLAAGLAGAGAGGAAGGIIGALTGAGMSEFRAKEFERLIGDGRIVIGVTAKTEPERRLVRETFASHDGEPVPETVEDD